MLVTRPLARDFAYLMQLTEQMMLFPLYRGDRSAKRLNDMPRAIQLVNPGGYLLLPPLLWDLIVSLVFTFYLK